MGGRFPRLTHTMKNTQPAWVTKLRRKSNCYVDMHRLPNGNLVFTANRECRKDLRRKQREEPDKFNYDFECDLIADMIHNEGLDFADDTVSLWGGPVLAEWGPSRLMTDREFNYFHMEGRRSNSMYWLQFESEWGEMPDGEQRPIVRDQVLCYQYVDYCCNSMLDDLLDNGYSVWHCGDDAAEDPGDTILELYNAMKERIYVEQPMLFTPELFTPDELPKCSPRGRDYETYHGRVPLELQVEWRDGCYQTLVLD